MRLRGRRTAAVGARRVLADGLCLAGVWVMTLDVSTLGAQTASRRSRSLRASASLTTDQRIAIAAAVAFSTITLGTPSAGLLALVAPVVLAIAVVRLRHLRHPAPI